MTLTTEADDRAHQNSLKAVDAVLRVLRSIQWDPQPAEKEGYFRVDLEEEGTALSDVHTGIRLQSERFVFYVNFRGVVSKARRGQVAEFITRVNYGLVIGNFEMDWENRTVRFKTSLDFTLVELSERLIQDAIMSTMDAVDLYAAGLAAVMSGEMKALEAITWAENGPPAEE